MMQEPANRIVVAVRTRDHSGPAPGSTIGKCSVCGEAILLSRGSRKRIKLGYTAYCSVCISKAIAENGDGGPTQFEFPTAEEMAECRGMAEPN